MTAPRHTLDAGRAYTASEPDRLYKESQHSEAQAVSVDYKMYTVEDRGYKTPCWIWRGGLTEKDYARASRNGKNVRMHRYLWEQINGPMPPGFVSYHLCRVRPCINPDHVEPVTSAENTRRRLTGFNPNSHRNRNRHFLPPNATLTFEIAEELRRRYAAGKITQAALAREFGLSPGAVNRVIRNQSFTRELW